ncbi:IS3 family transposase [Cryobacterium sp. 10I1]|uniref:IS3 family transposase n=1 Tax=unclassified Cryobacterium TaxID=2649013 RepID=UPI002B22386E|nr:MULTISPECIES: IS3 family transposase [unclassified Cryobacterium]MEB0005009.1 IS3 family transposase [Cryobacterium sp. RTC2.1]MEB0203806.1 IS3 family transposase [Cryobacterium sp. 5I3]MEB0307410.1 IS3 family transposase [Cryobacterium sp. 10I1]
MPKKHPTEVRERAVRMTLDRLKDYPSMWAACRDLAPKLNIGAETLRKWVTQAQADAGERSGPTSEELEEIKRLKRENRDLRETNDILKAAGVFLREGARPSQPSIVAFIVQMKANGHGVELTCGVLREQGVAVTSRSFRAWKTRAAAARVQSDAALVDRLKALKARDTQGRQQPEILYGRRKMTAWLNRGEFAGVSKHTVDRLMRLEGMNGLVRGRKPRESASAGKDSPRAPDLLKRNFSAPRPNHSWVTDFTYVPTWGGFVYVAFAIDLYSRAIVGWHASTAKDTPFVEVCLNMALWRRDRAGHAVGPGLIHHSDAGSQYTSIKFTETVALEGLIASIGTIGDAYDNAAAETVMGLYKNEAVAKNSPFMTGPLKTLADVEKLTFDWLDWYNNRRLHSALGNMPPEEYERNYYAETNGPIDIEAANKTAA